MGYAETSVFSKQFKKQYGQSPRAYIKALDRSKV
ncbi:AraC family transcriptional regulator [Parapedobacter sp.]